MISLTSLWRMVGKPPLGHVMARSTVNRFPQEQVWGMDWSCQPYLRHIASLNALLCRSKPCRAIRRAVSQVDAPFSWERSSRLCWWGSRHPLRPSTWSASLVFLFLAMLDLALCTTSSAILPRMSWLLIS